MKYLLKLKLAFHKAVSGDYEGFLLMCFNLILRIPLVKRCFIYKCRGKCSVAHLVESGAFSDTYNYSNGISCNREVNNSSACFTIVAKNYMHFALTARETFLRCNHRYDFYIIIMDRVVNSDDIAAMNTLNRSGVRFLFFDEISLEIAEDYTDMLMKYNVMEMCTALKPYAFEFLMNRYKQVIYVDPDTAFYSSIAAVEEQLGKSDIVITPHRCSPYPEDGKRTNDSDALVYGAYNLGFLAINANEMTLQFIKWWQRKVAYAAFSDTGTGVFTDQKWIDLVPGYFDNVAILKNKELNIAYWNIDERTIYFYDNRWMVENKELVFFHFSGIVLGDTKVLSKWQNRYILADFPMLASLFDEYREAVQTNKKWIVGGSYYFDDYFRNYNIDISNCRKCVKFRKLLELRKRQSDNYDNCIGYGGV